MKLKLAIATLAFAGLSFSRAETKVAEEQPVIQIAILLDNSGSMSGLISQAKSQLWNIVNEFIHAKKDGKAPKVQVALFEYGINTEGENGHIRQLSPLTEDLDKLSEQLFAINSRSSGGNEYCGWVMNDAIEKLSWDKSSKTYKAIFIAGNEAFTQGKIDYRNVCKEAISKGVIVNTIHCGDEAAGISGQWKNGADLADGKFLNINHNAAVAVPSAPQDKEIAEWNGKLNGTYIGYGAAGKDGLMRQNAQDANAAAEPGGVGVLAGRAQSKASAVYNNSGWDLVDWSKGKDADISKLPVEQLPEEMKKMTVEERKAHIEKKTAERGEIQKRIGELAKEREKFITEELKKKGEDKTLGNAVNTAVREQAAKKGVTFGEK